MIDTIYTASKTRSNRPGWSITFRHPLRKDARGTARKIRRGLGTPDAAKADELVEQMNQILRDPSWWHTGRRAEAESRFAKPVVDAFYDEIQAGQRDPEQVRNELIRLPSREDDIPYARILNVGTTGAGKTSLVRQFIGSDPDIDRFPSTAPAKTTIADLEVILAEGPLEAVVTFFSEFQVVAWVDECLIDSCYAALADESDDKVADRFLNHRDQRFRLSYCLGAWRKEGAEDDEFSFDDDQAGEVSATSTSSPNEISEQKAALKSFVERIKVLTRSTSEALRTELGGTPDEMRPADREAQRLLVQEQFETYLIRDETFHDLAQDVLDAIRQRFERIPKAELVTTPSGWPEYWHFVSDDRNSFIDRIRWFSSNHWAEFGRLLTPIVQGLRIKGPLYPDFTDRHPCLVLIDGQGLGHTPDSSSSVTTHITRRFADVDVILLVDSAAQPMQAAPLSVVRAVATSGHHEKLAIAFTHFDQIKGQSLPTFTERRAHVMASVLNALSGLKDAIGAPVVQAIEQDIDVRCFMLGGVDRALRKLPPKAGAYMADQLNGMIDFFEKSILPPPPLAAKPEYDPTGLSFAVQEAVSKFRAPWLARLGRATYEGINKVHWTKVKALTRRIASGTDVEYDNLQPLADLVSRLTESVSLFLDRPSSWAPKASSEEEEQLVIATIRRSVSAELHGLITQRLIEQQLSAWRAAYDNIRGTGSADKRAIAVAQIYDSAAPVPGAVMTAGSKEFLVEVRKIVIGAIEASGGATKVDAESV